MCYYVFILFENVIDILNKELYCWLCFEIKIMKVEENIFEIKDF